MLTEKESKAICNKLLRYTNADDAQVSVSSENFSHLRFAANAFATSGRREDTTANITVWIDKRRGAASTNDMDDASLKTAVEEAERIARISPVDKEYMPTLSRQTYKPAAGYIDATVNISLPDRAKAIDEIIRECTKQGVIGAGFHHATGTAVGSAAKNGNFYYHRATLAALSVTTRTPDGGSSGYFLRNHFDVSKLDTTRIGRESIRKALTSRNPRTIEPGVYSVILEPQAADDLIRFGFDARSADEGRSPYSAPGGKTKLGEKIFDERIRVCSDPWHPELPGSPAASEGIPAEKMY